ncbi:MAG: hypothetical protein K2F71_05395, partial [Paramuribaculum sp.]|nr:hypothetical protein [Paramuribaculum sp.]
FISREEYLFDRKAAAKGMFPRMLKIRDIDSGKRCDESDNRFYSPMERILTDYSVGGDTITITSIPYNSRIPADSSKIVVRKYLLPDIIEITD